MEFYTAHTYTIQVLRMFALAVQIKQPRALGLTGRTFRYMKEIKQISKDKKNNNDNGDDHDKMCFSLMNCNAQKYC